MALRQLPIQNATPTAITITTFMAKITDLGLICFQFQALCSLRSGVW